jgi:hypothetical protein
VNSTASVTGITLLQPAVGQPHEPTTVSSSQQRQQVAKTTFSSFEIADSAPENIGTYLI